MLCRSTREQVVEAIQVQEAINVSTLSGVVRAKTGDWLILDPQGNLNRCDNLNFQCTYEAVQDSRESALVSEGKPCGC
jgi:ketosteroid isomerase-like protein